MNVIEKIIAKNANRDIVKVGEELNVKVDLAITHDVTGPMAIEQFEKIGANEIFDKKKVVFVLDHNIPCSTVNSRVQHKTIIDFCNKYGAKIYSRSQGVIHQLVHEENLYKKGDVIVGADSHTCTAGAFGAVGIMVGSTEIAAVMALGEIAIEVPETFLININGKLNPGVYGKDIILYLIGKFGTDGFTDKALILSGSTILNLSDDEKMTISNMFIEMGAMIGLIDQGDEEIGEVSEVYNFESSDIEPVIACPYSPGNVKLVKEVKGQKISQAVIGSCTNGRYSDMKMVADILKNNKVADDVNLLIIPASKNILEKMENEGLTKIMRSAGAIITNPGCGPCFGAHQGLLAKQDVAISSTNRNFPGRMGHKEAKIYLASPRTVAESAVMGYITEPGTVIALEECRYGFN